MNPLKVIGIILVLAKRRHLLGLGLPQWIFLALALIAQPSFAAERLNVVASFSILGDFARQVGGDKVDVTMLVGPDSDVHVYTPTPHDARDVADADRHPRGARLPLRQAAGAARTSRGPAGRRGGDPGPVPAGLSRRVRHERSGGSASAR